MAVNRMEGHLKWIHELEHIIQENAKQENESLENYCARLLKNKNIDDEAATVDVDNDDPEKPLNCNLSPDGHLNPNQDPDEHLNPNQNHDDIARVRRVNWTEKATFFAGKLSAVAFSIVTGNTGNAQLILGMLDHIVEILDDSTGNQCEVILYCMDVLRWQIGGGIDNEVAERLNRKWKDITGSNESMATVSFLKGMFGLALTIEENAVKRFYMEAIELDPNCLVWYHHAYRCLRRGRGRGGMQGGPSKQEEELARRAYQLCNGEDMISVVNYALTLKEFLWTQRRNVRFWRNNYEVYLECVQVFENAVQLALATQHWIMKCKLYLAEFLYFGSAPQADKMRGREMLLELERDHPNSLPVLHKLGNLYRDEGLVQRARYCYNRALEIHPTMVPCIMDYLRLLKENLQKNAFLRNRAKAEMTRVLDRALSPDYVRSDKNTQKLRNEQRKLENLD